VADPGYHSEDGLLVANVSMVVLLLDLRLGAPSDRKMTILVEVSRAPVGLRAGLRWSLALIRPCSLAVLNS
jgi:hypothetical protein